MEELWDPSRTGFLPARLSDNILDPVLRHHTAVYEELPQLSKRGEIRLRIDALPLIKVVFSYDEFVDVSCLLVKSAEATENLFALFGFLAGAYVHCERLEFTAGSGDAAQADERDPVPVVLPATIAVPLKVLAARVDRQPILDYAGCVLTNWKLIDELRPLSLENIQILRTFTRLRAEEWFYMVHVVIEHHGGEAIQRLFEIEKLVQSADLDSMEEETEFKDIERVIACADRLCDALRQMNGVLSKMGVHCDQFQFYNIVRPWLSSWPDVGVIYATANGDTDNLAPEVYSGGSGAQSSLMPCFDHFFGIKHGKAGKPSQISEEDRVKFVKSLRRYQGYMPRTHREAIEKLGEGNIMREYIGLLDDLSANLKRKSVNPELPIFVSEQYRMKYVNISKLIVRVKKSYNFCIEEVLNFRRKHIGMAISYINGQTNKRVKELRASGRTEEADKLAEMGAVGTGGSMFHKHLMQHVNDTRSCLYAIHDRETHTREFLSAQKYVLPGLGRLLPGSVFGKRVVPVKFGITVLSHSPHEAFSTTPSPPMSPASGNMTSPVTHSLVSTTPPPPPAPLQTPLQASLQAAQRANADPGKNATLRSEELD